MWSSRSWRKVHKEPTATHGQIESLPISGFAFGLNLLRSDATLQPSIHTFILECEVDHILLQSNRLTENALQELLPLTTNNSSRADSIWHNLWSNVITVSVKLHSIFNGTPESIGAVCNLAV